MKAIFVSVLFTGFLLARPAAGQAEPCRFLTMQAVLNALDNTGYSGEGDVQCYDEYNNQYQGMFSAKAWIVDETTGTTVADTSLPACSGSACNGRYNWVGGVSGLFTARTHCYRARVQGASTFYSNEVGSGQKCDPGPASGGTGGTGGGSDCVVTETNPCTGGGGGSGGTTDYRVDTCYYQVYDCMSPIIFNLQNGGYQLSGMDSSVSFDIDADGSPNRMNWTAAGAQMGFLALDRNGNGRIDDGSELFGDHTRLRDGSLAHNGFEALRELDSNGDGVIDERDSDWQHLLVWIDANHDGISTPDELHPIGTTGITAVELSYHWTGRRDKNGNCFRYEGKVHFGSAARTFYDIYFLVAR